jgi:hypothetical protein
MDRVDPRASRVAPRHFWLCVAPGRDAGDDEDQQHTAVSTVRTRTSSVPSEAIIESIALDGVGPESCLVVLFRISVRPECLFGHRTPLWPADEPTDDKTPESAGAWCIYFGVDEYVDQGGLVVHTCEPEGITWLPE